MSGVWHWFLYTWNPFNWSPNISAGLVIGAFMMLFWKPITSFVKKKIHKVMSEHPIHSEIQFLHTKMDALMESNGVDSPERPK